VRTVEHSDGVKKAYITMKHGGEDLERKEWEFEVDFNIGFDYMGNLHYNKMGLGFINKTRHVVRGEDDHKWEIDVFHKDNEGLILAELELPWPSTPFCKLEGIGNEVTNDKRYYNSYLAQHPYKEWEGKGPCDSCVSKDGCIAKGERCNDYVKNYE
ncbi:hypothetical protein LCGC14_2927780, partial [marine sediment metagenome]